MFIQNQQIIDMQINQLGKEGLIGLGDNCKYKTLVDYTVKNI
jgi:hypothetical protein